MSTPHEEHPYPQPYGPYPPAGPPTADPAPAPRRPLWPAVRAGALAVPVIALAGVPLGLLWRWIAPDVPVVLTRVGPYPVESQPEQFVAADSWFALLGAGFGLFVAALAWWLLRRHRGPVALAAVLLGCLAAAFLAWQAGRWWGLTDFAQWSATGALGSSGVRPADVRAYGVLLVPAFAAVILYTLLAGWSHDPELSSDDEAPDVVDGPGQVSSDWPDGPAPTAAPAPPVPGAATSPPG